jgi:hypothetical protein
VACAVALTAAASADGFEFDAIKLGALRRVDGCL